MQAKCQIICIGAREFTGKKGKVEVTVVTLLDLDPQMPLLNTFDLELTGDARLGFKAKRGETVNVGIKDLRAGYGGRMQVVGAIL